MPSVFTAECYAACLGYCQPSVSFPVLKDVNLAMQYGLVQGYAYFLVYGLSMIAAGYVTDKYKLNRVYVVAIGSGLTGAALVIEVRHSRRSLACT